MAITNVDKCGQVLFYENKSIGLHYSYTNLTLAFADIKQHLSTSKDTLFLEGRPFSGVLKKSEDNVRREMQYLNGQLHGIQKKYYNSGQIKEAILFTNGKENGRCICYFECGAKKMNANYSSGELDGLYEEWDPNGCIVTRKTYYNGRLVAVSNATRV